jgi:Tfp pilus assembly protein PilO
MRRTFNWQALKVSSGDRGPRFWLQLAGIVLAVLNCAALFFYLYPVGGSREELTYQSQQVRAQIGAARTRENRLATIAAKVQLGSTECANFEATYFLPKRHAYESVVTAIQDMAKGSGLQERDTVYTEEPIEGTADLNLLNITGNYEGTYENLMKFVNAVDRSPMLLMLDQLQAAPQQRGGMINSSIRFQAIVREDQTVLLGARQ